MNKGNGPGYIYAMINPSMPGKMKLGYSDNVERRRKEHSRATPVPEPFIIYRHAYVENMKKAENQMHDIFDEQRISNNKEFFDLSPEEVDPYFNHLDENKILGFNYKAIREIKIITKKISKEVKDLRKKIKTKGKVRSIKTNFSIVRYYPNGWKNIIIRGLRPFNTNLKSISVDYYNKKHKKLTGKKYENNFRTHAERAGVIEYNKIKNMYNLTSLGLQFKENQTNENFIKCIKNKINKKNNLEFYPYNSILKIINRVKKINNFEFLWGIYIMKDTSEEEIEKCISRINQIRNSPVNIEKFIKKDLTYMRFIIYTFNNFFKHQLSIFNDEFKISDFLGNATSRLDLEFDYLKVHMSTLWAELSIKDDEIILD